MNARSQTGISHPFAAPEAATPVEVAPGILWVRVPFAGPPGHVNALALDDGDGWTLVDPGFDTPAIRAQWEGLLAGPLAGRPVTRVLVTHHHADHVGMAGVLAARGAELVMTRTAFLLARMLILDPQDEASDAAIAFWRRAGLPADEIARRRTERPWNMADVSAPLPAGYSRIAEGDTIRLAGRDWTIRTGDGHAPEHATLWTEGVVIGGDQLLPGISPNLGVWPTEPEADPVGDWLASCRKLAAHATDAQLVLPGHKLPYRGLPGRLAAMERNHLSALDRLADFLTVPARAVECFDTLFGRMIGPAETHLAMAETVGHLNHLLRIGRATREEDADGAWLWRATERG